MARHTAQYYEKHTNKKLLHARLLLELCEEQEEPYTTALRESYIIHLMSSYDSLVNEIQARINLIPQREPNPITIAQHMERAGISTMTEINMLVRLEEDPSSWLVQLRKLYRELASNPQDDSQDLINYAVSQPHSLESYLTELEHLVKQLRSLMTES